MLFSSRTSDAAKIAAGAQNIHQHTTTLTFLEKLDPEEEEEPLGIPGLFFQPRTIFGLQDSVLD